MLDLDKTLNCHISEIHSSEKPKTMTRRDVNKDISYSYKSHRSCSFVGYLAVTRKSPKRDVCIKSD